MQNLINYLNWIKKGQLDKNTDGISLKSLADFKRISISKDEVMYCGIKNNVLSA